MLLLNVKQHFFHTLNELGCPGSFLDQEQWQSPLLQRREEIQSHSVSHFKTFMPFLGTAFDLLYMF